MNRVFRLGSCALFAVVLAMGLGVSLSPSAHAQVTQGLTAVGGTIGLSAADPRVIAAKVINVFLGLLAVIFLGLTVYAGFLWMTSGGEAAGAEKARTMLRNAVIGLIIILSSWAITRYVISHLLDATGGDGTGGIVDQTGGSAGGFGSGGAFSNFQLRSITPVGSLPIRNVRVHFVFSRAVDPGAAAVSIHIYRASDRAAVDGTLTVNGQVVEFTPTAPCPTAPGERCLEGDTDFIAFIDRTLRSLATPGESSQRIICGGLALSCESSFRTGNRIDTQPPTATIQVPFDGQSVPQDDAITVSTRAIDDVAISYVSSSVNGDDIGADAPTTTVSSFTANIEWSTRGAATGTYALRSQASDISGHNGFGRISVVIRPPTAFDGIRDGSETDVDCGGPNAGACAGGHCVVGTDCRSGICTDGVCVGQPVIQGVSPSSGGPGTMITITGENFGNTRGDVRFWDGTGFTIPALAPALCASEATWLSGQIIVQVPAGITAGLKPMQVTNSTSHLSDATNDRNGRMLDVFTVNTTPHPGLCAIRPTTGERGDAVTLTGAGLGAARGQVWFGEGRDATPSVSSWSETRISTNVPIASVGSHAVYAVVGGQRSNTVGFRVTERVHATPLVNAIDPEVGPIGEYVTLTGHDFGTTPGRVVFQNTGTDETGNADITFPVACSRDFWHDTSITVKVPTIVGLRTSVTPGPFSVYILRSGDNAQSNRKSFLVNRETPHPGICAIAPIAGPVGTVVSLIGERLGGVSGAVSFQGSAAAIRVPAVVTPPVTESSMITSVPTGAYTGPVRVAVRDVHSNGVSFAVGNCNETPGMCGTQTCCRESGQCSVLGLCADVATSTMFGWELSTGPLPVYPEVVEECTGPTGLPPSPSPWNVRSGGDAVCVNAEAVVRFNTGIDPATINSRTIIVSRCTASGDNPCATKIPVRTSPFQVSDSDGTPGAHRTLIAISPLEEVGTTPDWRPGTLYDVVLTTGLVSNGHVAMRPLERCGPRNGYCFRFQTRASTERCQIGSVGVTPNPFTATTIDEVVEPYVGSARSAQDACIQINPRGLSWSWSTAPLAPSILPDTRALLSPYRGRACSESSGTCSWLQRATAQNQTEPDPPVRVTATASVTGQSSASGAALLSIAYTQPRVVSYGPQCNEACTDATIWAEFNVPMDPAFVSVRQVLLYKCTNANCDSFFPSTPLTLAPGSVTLAPSRTPSVTRPADRRLVINPIDALGASLLEVGAFYKVIVLTDRVGTPCLLGLCSRTRLPLTTSPPNNDPRGFFWRFRVKESNRGLCDVTRVDVLPVEKIETVVGARELFAATPINVSEACGEQYLMDSATPYAWTSSLRDVSTFINSRGNGLMSVARVLTANCSSRCLNLGSEGVYGRTASCGNRVVETGEECDLGSEASGGSNGVRGSACASNCLWAGVEGGTCGNGRIDLGEQCDPGPLTGPRPGCSDHCLALGSSSVTTEGRNSICGSNTLDAGETCDDGNRNSGDGCSADCLHEGSQPIVALCGNGGALEPGESCEKNADGTWPLGCDHTTCLHTGTDACRGVDGLQCCGKGGALEPGEDCDDGNSVNGDGCSSRCLLEGSSIAYRPHPSLCGDGIRGVGEQCESTGVTVVGSHQLSEIVGTHEPDTTGRMMSRLEATYRAKTGQANHGLQCGFRHEMECVGDPADGRTITSHGLTENGCCMERPTVTTTRFPHPDSRDVCRNTEISFNTSQRMDEASIHDNVIVGEEMGTGVACPSGTTPFGEAFPRTCIGGVVGTIRTEPATAGTRVIFALTRALKATTDYRIIVRGDQNLADDIRVGVRNQQGVLMAGSTSWIFRTAANLCLVSDLEMRDTDPVRPFLFQQPTESHLYSATVVSVQQGGGTVPISSVDEYGWTWQPWLSSHAPILTASAATEMTAAERVAQRATTSTIQAHNRSGSSFIFAGIQIVRDTVSAPSTLGRTFNTSHMATVSLCERPWPFADPRYHAASLFSDAAIRSSEPSVLTDTIFARGPYYNVATNYCMDAGVSGVATDDLPALTIRPTPPDPSHDLPGILRQYLFTFEGADVADVLRKDAIGVRIFQNPLHLSPRAWYLSRGFRGSPTSMDIDGYEAVRDGDNIYVSAPNVENAGTGPVTSIIYFFSRNPDAERVTKNIFNQLIKNLVFNVNIERDSSNVCQNEGVVYTDSHDRVVPCSSDWECASVNTAFHCASFKAKIQRDIQRLADFQTFMTKIEAVRTRDGKYPTITDGSYLQGLTNSRWGSWQSVLGAAIGGTPPIDPVNRFLTCGRCQYTASTAVGEPCVDAADCRAGGTCAGVPRVEGSPKVYDPSTCWELTNRRFLCPRLPTGPSRFYQYRSLGAGAGYELGTELEAASYDRYRPALVTGLKRCTNTGQLCELRTGTTNPHSDCITYFPGTIRIQSSGQCQPTGGQWRYSGICTGSEFGVDTVCGNGVRSPSEACEVGDTATASCTTSDGHPGMEQRVCAPDCQSFVASPSLTRCVPLLLCGNGRVDNLICNGGVKFGQSCTTASIGASTECADPRNPPTVQAACVFISSVIGAPEEVCDDGAALNGTYGHCNRTCTGYDDRCGDGQISLGETCDNAATNGQYCGVGCSVAESCGINCHSRAPYCGDGVVQTGDGEQCEPRQSHTTTEAVCNRFSAAAFADKKACRNDADCVAPGDTSSAEGLCGHRGTSISAPLQGHYTENSCVGYLAYRCVGSGTICEGDGTAGDRRRCSSDTDCLSTDGSRGGHCVARERVNCETDTACGPGGRCNSYPTQRVQMCGPVASTNPDEVIAQCTWARWSDCLPAASCGDGVVDPGETCDDGNDIDNDRCTSQCQRNTCGDGYLNVGVEQCDYGNIASGGRNGLPCVSEYGSTCATCNTSCHVEAQSGGFCGDGRRGGREQCDFVGVCEGGTSPGARCTSNTECGTGSVCRFPGVASTSTCLGIGYDYANDSVCDTNAYITEPGSGGIVCVHPTDIVPPDSRECTICSITVGAMSRPLRSTARLTCIGDGCPGGAVPFMQTDADVGSPAAIDALLHPVAPLSPDTLTPFISIVTRTNLGFRTGGICRSCRGGSCVYHPPSPTGPSAQPVEVTLANQAACIPDTIRDHLTCATSCSLAGCGSCLAAPARENAVVIEGQVYDAFAQLPIAGAHVILTYRGNQIADTVTDGHGGFRIPNLHGRSECGQYRLTVSAERDNPLTPSPEVLGYRPFDSGMFSPVDFLTRVTMGGRIDLSPRTGEGDVQGSGGLLTNETRVLVTWTGSLPTFTLTGENAGRYVQAILPHLILPASKSFKKTPPTVVGGSLTCTESAILCSYVETTGNSAWMERNIMLGLLCEAPINVFSPRTAITTPQFACGYVGPDVTARDYPLSSVNTNDGYSGALCCPRTGNAVTGEITLDGSRVINAYLNRTSGSSGQTLAARDALLSQACCRGPLTLVNAEIVGYAASTACTPGMASCDPNASPSRDCCRRDVGSGATWQGLSDIAAAPGAVASCMPHAITTAAVCTSLTEAGTPLRPGESASSRPPRRPGDGPGGLLTRLACTPSNTCDEFVRQAAGTDPMRVRYIRSLSEGDVYSFYLEQPHYAEALAPRILQSRRDDEACDDVRQVVETCTTERAHDCPPPPGPFFDPFVCYRRTLPNISAISPPSVLFSTIGLRVQVLSGTDRITIQPGPVSTSCTNGRAPYMWHAFDQNAHTGEITIAGDGVHGQWVCDSPEGITGLNRPMTDTSYKFPGSVGLPIPDLGLPADVVSRP